MSEVLIAGRRIRTDPARALGSGGEADVYDIGDGLALKVYKTAKHPDYAGDDHAKRAASARIAQRQAKLPAFPKRVPERVVAPVELARDPKSSDILGYTMRMVSGAEPLLRFGEPSFRRSGAVPAARVLAILRDLHRTVGETHAAGIVIGDFNDLNVLVEGERAFLIDADSFQFGGFFCDVFTERFVDPRLCDSNGSAPMLARPFTPASDWYSFETIVVQSLLLVGPWGGVHRTIKPGRRALERIPVWHKDVVYPRPAIPWSVLPDDLLQRFHRTFEKDDRDPFPRVLLESLRWTKCATCGLEHARSLCPRCTHATPAAVVETIARRGEVVARRVLRTRGTLVHVSIEEKPRWIVHESGSCKREDGTEVARGALDPRVEFAIAGDATLIARNGRIETPDGPLGADAFAFAAGRLFRSDDGALMRASFPFALSEPAKRVNRNAAGFVNGTAERVGDVLAGQTRLWAGRDFGCGFYRAGGVQVAFVFEAERGRLRDDVKLPRLPGKLIDARCTFGADRAWVFFSIQDGARIVHQCVLVRRDGAVEASAAAIRGDGTWLGGGIGGACAAGAFLFVPTDAGVVRVEASGAGLAKTRDFPDTEPFVDSACRLHAANDGLWVQSDVELVHLQMK